MTSGEGNLDSKRLIQPKKKEKNQLLLLDFAHETRYSFGSIHSTLDPVILASSSLGLLPCPSKPLFFFSVGFRLVHVTPAPLLPESKELLVVNPLFCHTHLLLSTTRPLLHSDTLRHTYTTSFI